MLLSTAAYVLIPASSARAAPTRWHDVAKTTLNYLQSLQWRKAKENLQ